MLVARGNTPPLLLLDDVLSELDQGRRRVLATPRRGHGPDGGHRDAALGASGRAGTTRRGGAWIGSVTAVRDELSRFGPQAEIGRVAEAWADAVGEQIARNAWPARIARDGTLHVHTSSSTWAFELEHLAADIRTRLGELAPPKLRFMPGPLPEPQTAASDEAVGATFAIPSAEDLEAAAELAAKIEDEKLRNLVARAAAASLARARSDHAF